MLPGATSTSIPWLEKSKQVHHTDRLDWIGDELTAGSAVRLSRKTSDVGGKSQLHIHNAKKGGDERHNHKTEKASGTSVCPARTQKAIYRISKPDVDITR